MWKICLLFTWVAVAAVPQGDRIMLLDLKPEEVQALLAKQNTDLHFAPKIDTIQVARTSPEEEDQIEDVYESSQFHGQDGLGRYLYGYAVPDIAKVEARNINGQIRGAYNWVEPAGNVIKVKYWDNGDGFHQEDNIPKVVLKPVQESEAVRKARLAHEKAWKEAAAANQVSPALINLVYKNDQSENYGQESRASPYAVQPAPLKSWQNQPQPYNNYGQESRASAVAAPPPTNPKYYQTAQPQQNQPPAFNNYGQESRASAVAAPPPTNPNSYQTPQSQQNQPPAYNNYGQESQVSAVQTPYSAQHPAESRPAPVSVQSPAAPKRERQVEYDAPAPAPVHNDGRYVPDDEETTSEPRGFFYSFVYPTGIRYKKTEYDAKKLTPHDDVTSLGGGQIE